MRLIIVVALATLAVQSQAQATEVDVMSADVIRVEGNEWRIANIEAPQIDSACGEERSFAFAARAKLAEILSNGSRSGAPVSAALEDRAPLHVNVQGKLIIAPTGMRDYLQRETANVSLNYADVGEKMIYAGAAMYRGRGRPLCFAAVFGKDFPLSRNASSGIDRGGAGHPATANTPPAPTVGIRR